MGNLLARGAWTGAGFGLAVVTLEICFGIAGMLSIGIALPRSALLMALGLEVGIGLSLGLLLAPLLRVPAGRWLHLAGIALVWLGLIFFAGIGQDDSGLLMALTPWIAGALLTVGGRWVAGKRPRLPVAAAALALLTAFAIPEVYTWLIAPDSALSEGAPAAAEGAPDVVLVVLDTVRADHVGAYGYPRNTTPQIDALAAQSSLFLDATAPASWSLPSHASLFTGRFASGHQAHAEHRFLETTFPTLAETLAAAGYETRCFTANAWISDTLGLTRGFAWSDEAWRSGEMGRTRVFGFRLLDRLGFGAQDKGGAAVAENFENWAAEAPTDGRPTFAFLNFIEAHFPYHQVPDAYLERFSTRSRAELRELSMHLVDAQFGADPPDLAEATGPAIDMYDAGLAYADHLLGRVVEALRARGTLDRTILVVLSDHGELLAEHGTFGHGNSVYEAEARVPLLVRYPPVIAPGVRSTTPVSTVGVFATILDLAGLERQPSVQVTSLLPALRGGPPGGPVLSERFAGDGVTSRAESVQDSDPLLHSGVRFRSYRVGQEKLVESSDGTLYLFDVSSDPGEVHNLASERAADVARLRSELDAWQAAIGLPAIDAPVAAGEAPELDAAARERLRGLGYLE